MLANLLLVLWATCSPLSSLAAPGTPVPGIAVQDPKPADGERARLERLGEIARALQDPASDAVALTTEAVRLVGFVLWSEERKVLAEPTGAPRLHLAITDAEIRAYTRMFRDGHTVARSDLIGAMDVLFRGLGGEGSVERFLRDWMNDGFNSGNPSVRALTAFVQDLGFHRAGAEGRIEGEAECDLDPLQALLVLRVLTEDMGTPLRRAIARGEIGAPPKEGGKEEEAEAPRGPAVAARGAWARADEPPGWGEDAYVGGITGLFGEVVGTLGKLGKGISDGVGKTNAISTIAKFIATYTFLKGETRVEDPGQPLIRTKDRDPGEQRTLVARFYIDGTRVTDWMKEHRVLVATAGLDIDMPKTGALKGVETEWDIKQDRHSSKGHLIQTVRGTGDISKIKTDANGEARIRVEGTPQPRKLDPNAVMPLDKSVRIVVTPQVKATEMQQDLVDAVTGAIGIKGGPPGWITPVIECLYRMKWKGGPWFDLQVRDWQPAETIGQAEITVRASGSSFSRRGGYRMTLQRTLKFSDVRMNVSGFEMPKMPDPELLKLMPPNVRKQMEEGMRQMAEAAKKRMFMGRGPGLAELHIHDSAAGFMEADGCDDGSTETRITWDGDESMEWTEEAAALRGVNFMIDADLDRKVAVLRVRMLADTRVVTTTRGSKGKSQTHEQRERMEVLSGLELEPPFNKSIEIPLNETEIRDMGASNYYGVVAVPFRFGPQDRFRGTAHVAYSATRKLSPKEGGR